jgi:hypothetical protein
MDTSLFQEANGVRKTKLTKFKNQKPQGLIHEQNQKGGFRL